MRRLLFDSLALPVSDDRALTGIVELSASVSRVTDYCGRSRSEMRCRCGPLWVRLAALSELCTVPSALKVATLSV